MLQGPTSPPELPGLPLTGVADGAPWQHVLPGCQAVVVYASGHELWDLLAQRIRTDPDFAQQPDPIDTLVAETIARLPSALGGRWVRCANDASPQLDFRSLAAQAGLGWPSRLGLLLHPERGPWIGLRAAWFTTAALTITGPLSGSGPCRGCAAPCAMACPAAALPPSGWRADRCLPHQAQTRDCEGGCLARSACPVGQDAAYTAAQHRYHHHPASRRQVLDELRALVHRLAPRSR